MPDAAVAKHLSITGRVQGVSYRASALAEARRLGLVGWVRNRRDGSVEAVVSGPETAVETFIAWARGGPPGARVDQVVAGSADVPDGSTFEMHPTA